VVKKKKRNEGGMRHLPIRGSLAPDRAVFVLQHPQPPRERVKLAAGASVLDLLTFLSD